MYKVIKGENQNEKNIKNYQQFMDFLETLPVDSEDKDDIGNDDENLAGDKVLNEDDIIESALRAAEEIKDNARISAQDILESARQEGIKQGLEEGFKQGYSDGIQKAEKEIDEKLRKECERLSAEVAVDIKSFSDEREKMLEYYIDDLKEIALAIGEKIVQTSLRSSAQVIERMIIKATEKMKKVGWAKIYIGGDGVGSEIQGDTEFLKSLSHLAHSVKIVIIDEDEPGTCIVETPEGILDISIKTQLENIKEILNNARL